VIKHNNIAKEEERRSEDIIQTIGDCNSTETTSIGKLVCNAQATVKQRFGLRAFSNNSVKENRPVPQQMRMECW